MWGIREATLEDAIGILGHTKTILKTSTFMLTTHVYEKLGFKDEGRF